MIEPQYSRQRGAATEGQTEYAEAPNPGELAVSPRYGTGADPLPDLTSGNGQVGLGALVGIMRNLEFSAGGRAHRVSMGSYTKA